MDIFQQLADAVITQHQEGELPDFLVPDLMEVAEHPTKFGTQKDLVTELIQRVNLYETYSEMCCEKMGYGLEDIQRTLGELHKNI